jgi:hypothetical protein
VAVAVLRELEIVSDAMKPNGDQPDASPGVEPAVQELQFGRARRELEEAEAGDEILAALGPSVEPR